MESVSIYSRRYKAHQIFRKMNVFYPLIRTRSCSLQTLSDVLAWQDDYTKILLGL